MSGAWGHVKTTRRHLVGAWRRVRHPMVAILTDLRPLATDLPNEAKTTKIRFELWRRKEQQQLREERGARATPEWVEIAQIHLSRAETPLLVVLLAKMGLSGGAIGLGRSCRRNWRHGRLELGGRWRRSRNTAWWQGRPKLGGRRKRSGNTTWWRGWLELGGRRKERWRMSLTFIGGHMEMALIPC